MVGIIAEYNPFHNGHKYQLDEARRISGCDDCIAVMSGNFVQRGEPALLDKYLRTEAALKCGVDLVLELPTVYSCTNAEFFARASVRMLYEAGVSAICFGSESGDIDELIEMSEVDIRGGQNSEQIKKLLSEGLPYPAALTQVFGERIKLPNNILAIEYLRAIRYINAHSGRKIIPLTVKRNSSHNALGLEGHFSSSTAIRNSIKQGMVAAGGAAMPPASFDILKNNLADLSSMDNLSDIFKYRLKNLGASGLSNISEFGEGLENRFIKFERSSHTISEFLENVKTKRYTMARLKRLVIHTILNYTKSYYFERQRLGPEYLRVLGFVREKSHLLGKIKACSSIPLITNLKNTHIDLSDEAFATEIHGLSLSDKGTNSKPELRRETIILNR